MPAQYIGLRNDQDGLSTSDADRTTRDGAKVVTDSHGKYLQQAINGRVYTGVGASTGIALIAPAAGGGHPTLWNPSDSDVYLSIIRLEMGHRTGTHKPGGIEWASTLNTGASVATGAPILTFTVVAPIALAGGLQNKGQWSPTVNTFTAAPVFLRPAGIGCLTLAAATDAAPYTMRVQYDGDFVLAPGTAVSLCFQAATTTAVFQVAVTWEELAY